MFNDPFDHQIGFIWPYDPAEFAERLTSACERVIWGGEEMRDGRDSRFQRMLQYLRTRQARLPKAELLNGLRASSLLVAEELRNRMPSLNGEIQAHLCHSRVFCVTERNDNLVMWSHYANEHKGAVFKLRCVDAIDNVLLAAQPVSYTDAYIPFPNVDEYARHLTGEAALDMGALMWKIAFTKHVDWGYEKEWRVHRSMLSGPTGDGYSVYEQHASVFEAVYLGCRMPAEDVERITIAIMQHLPNTQIFRAKSNTDSFGLTFDS